MKNISRINTEWMGALGSSFSVKLDGMGQLLCLLNAVAFPLIFIATWKSSYKKANNFFALMLLTQAGMMGVFLAMDALVFYFFWELALIPAIFFVPNGVEKKEYRSLSNSLSTHLLARFSCW